MDFQTKAQVPAQNKEGSTTMWTQPETDEQKKFFSKHAAKRRVYGIVMTVLQFLHAVLALTAWTAIISWAVSRFTDNQYIIFFLSAVALLVLHLLFRTTWSTYWYDRMDEDEETDSTIFIPASIILLLLFSEYRGAKVFLESKVEKATETHISVASTEFTPAMNAVDAAETAAKKRVRDAVTEKIAAVESPYTASIAVWNRKRAKDETERGYIRSNVRSLETQRANASLPYRNALADSMLSITNRYAAQRVRLEGFKSAKEQGIQNKNVQEVQRETTERSEAGTYAWLISIVLLFLISILGYAQVRINVKSGILPLRNYTVLDAHGSVVERIWTAISDAFNRRSLQFSVWLHRQLSPKDVLRTFDGTVVAKPGDYNTPENVYISTAPPSKTGKTRQQAESEVMQKLARNPGVKLSPQQFADEVNRSLRSNGHYPEEPLPLPPPRKPESEAAKTTAPAPTDEEQQALRKILTEGALLYPSRHNQETYDRLFGDSSPLLKGLQILNLTWGEDKEGIFCSGIRQSGQYYPVDGLLSLPYITFPPAQPTENGFLFKQEGILFKQIISESGKVIGLAYKGPRMEEIQTLSAAQVRSRIGMYDQNGHGRTDEAKTRNAAIWKFALSLFNTAPVAEGEVA